MHIAVLAETRDGESRVAATPDSVKALIKAGAEITVQKGAGERAAYTDAAYEAAGAKLATRANAVKGADALFCVRRPDDETLKRLKDGAVVIGLLEPHGATEFAQACADAKVNALAMEYTPRITRAQAMDALSSQSNLSGYRAVIEAAELYGRAFPMMMTAAGTIAPAKAFVMGAGVAGLQAIATARRLGAVVSATDVRPAAKEQVGSLGAKFVAVEDDEFKEAETAGGYAKEMSDDYKAKQAELVASHIAKQDIVITTALIPGRPAPRLITTAMVESMKPGSVIIDIAAANGGNCELTEADKVVEHNGVKIAGFTNLPARLAADSSQLLAKNLVNLFPLLVGEDAAFAPHWDDEVIKGMALTRDGAIIHPSLTGDA
ncbi:MAG: NAD(P)(+) transhydrogenase (Re/Si-specific) subunit alpha [Oceanicaulis sp.]|jgi:NAD(P) transhydrogenase subunit alpha|uniref:Re/Si-specific NAD(P)(+) transhydrogenase subunit alpha n=1 Tax=unclassified Oceanicaulis TaxID=2632123 RepID=UPI000066A12E|nr:MULTISPECIES: Re/Si-specific NAD(P)(+) transhydrogenase subunit alpha [unclassified Oceanicaulis]EAP90129.1 nicotinamide nucleotide transhydrogenase, subunit [Oceanicaulis sp. HTCC2633]MBC39122.1 NAD(P)(+) transhydrogenase (Re/Si-specific) subunit alpha [Oceanicaulis sp.]HBU61283.1 Re/Si-specific NAD(P)(+) transhydrogenase subunit alpha [Oceanicaulis sp.]